MSWLFKDDHASVSIIKCVPQMTSRSYRSFLWSPLIHGSLAVLFCGLFVLLVAYRRMHVGWVLAPFAAIEVVQFRHAMRVLAERASGRCGSSGPG